MKGDRLCALLAALFLLCGLGFAQRGVIEDGPDKLAETSSLGDAIAAAGNQPVHIIEIHGIAAEGSGDSLILQSELCKRLRDCGESQKTREWADTGVFSPDRVPDFEYMGRQIWASKEEWIASAPFVDHYVIPRSGGKVLIVDEINWWPIVFPIKCRSVMQPEAALGGLNEQYLADCSRPTTLDTDRLHYSQYDWLPDLGANHSRAAVINRALKNSIVDWGFSDAMLAAGSMHSLFVEAMKQLFADCARFNPDSSKANNWEQDKEQEFLFVTHSLGSYLALSTLDPEPVAGGPQAMATLPSASAPAQYIFRHASLLYFFANQIPLLELAGVALPSEGARLAAPGPGGAPASRLKQQVETWQKLRGESLSKRGALPSCPSLPQIVAWSDPSDLLTYRVPKIDNALVVNLYVVNAPHWFWLFEMPTSAHGDYVKNRRVIDVMMRRTSHECAPEAK